MAITKCLHMKQAKTGYPAKHLANGLRYIMNPEKTEHGRYVCGHNCIPEQALSQMVDTKRHFGKLDTVFPIPVFIIVFISRSTAY